MGLEARPMVLPVWRLLRRAKPILRQAEMGRAARPLAVEAMPGPVARRAPQATAPAAGQAVPPIRECSGAACSAALGSPPPPRSWTRRRQRMAAPRWLAAPAESRRARFPDGLSNLVTRSFQWSARHRLDASAARRRAPRQGRACYRPLAAAAWVHPPPP